MEHQDCHVLLGCLSEYIDGELSGELCAELERHMSGCENCRIVVDSLRKTISLYQVTCEEATVPEGVRERLYHRLKLEDFLEKKA